MVVEARTLLAKGKLDRHRRSQVLASHIPWEEAREELQSACRVPDEHQRGFAYEMLMKCACRSRAVESALQLLVDRWRTEQGSVRVRAVEVLSKEGAAAGMIQDSHLEMLQQAIANYAKSGYDPEEGLAWGKVVVNVMQYHLSSNTGANLQSPVMTWALEALPSVFFQRYRYREGKGLQDAVQEQQYMYLRGSETYLVNCPFLFNLLLLRDSHKSTSTQSREGEKLRGVIDDEGVKWVWSNVGSTVLQQLKELAIEEHADDSAATSYWFTAIALADLLATSPSPCGNSAHKGQDKPSQDAGPLFRLPEMQPLLELVLGALHPDYLPTFESSGSRRAGSWMPSDSRRASKRPRSGSKVVQGEDDSASKPPRLTPPALVKLVEFLLAHESTRGKVLETLQQNPKLIMKLAGGPVEGQSRALNKILAQQPEVLVPALLTLPGPDLVKTPVGDESMFSAERGGGEREEDLFGEDLNGEDLNGEDLIGEDLIGEDLHGEDLFGEDLNPEPLLLCCGVQSFARWAPSDVQTLLDKWLLPIAKLPCQDHVREGFKDGPRMLKVQERALDIIARLPLVPIAPLLEAEYKRHAARYWKLKKLHEGERGKRVRGEGDEGQEEEEKEEEKETEEAEEEERDDDRVTVAVKLAFSEVMMVRSLVAMARCVEGSVQCLSVVEEAVKSLPGDAGRVAARSLRRGCKFEPTTNRRGVGTDQSRIARLLEGDLPGIGVRRELLGSLDPMHELQVLEAQWDAQGDKTHRDVRCAIIRRAAETAVISSEEGSVNLLRRAAALAAASKPFSPNGEVLAQTLLTTVRGISQQTGVDTNLKQQLASSVLVPLLLLPEDGKGTEIADVRGGALREALVWVAECGRYPGGDAVAGILSRAASQGVLRMPNITWKERASFVKLLVEAGLIREKGSEASDELLSCVKELVAMLPEQFVHGVRVLSLIEASCSEVVSQGYQAQVQGGGLDREVWDDMVTAVIDEKNAVPVAIKLYLLGLHWEDAEVLPGELQNLCNGHPLLSLLFDQAIAESIVAVVRNCLVSEEGSLHESMLSAVSAAVKVLCEGDVRSRAAGCALLEAVMGTKPRGTGEFQAFAQEVSSRLQSLQNDEDEVVRYRAKWVAVRLSMNSEDSEFVFK